MMLEHALRYAERGWAVLPLHTPRGSRCSCGEACESPGKHPRLRGGVWEATTDRALIERWWGRWPDANIGIATGKASNLVVLDVDSRKGGELSLGSLGELPPTPTVRTGNGLHLYFVHPGDRLIRNRVNLLPGLDLRGDGGYVVAPPSLHDSGAAYVWETPPEEVTPPPLPPLLLEILVTPQAAAPVGAKVYKGERNNVLTSLAGTLRRRGLEAEEILTLLLEVNRTRCRPPLAEEEVRKIVNSIVRYDPGDPLWEQRELDIAEFSARDGGLYLHGKLVADFVIEPVCVLVREDGDELIRAKVTTRSAERVVDLPRAAFVDARTFSTHLPLADAVWLTEKRSVLRLLQRWLAREGVPRVHAIGYAGRWEKDGRAYWVTSAGVLTKDGAAETAPVMVLEHSPVAQFVPLRYPKLEFSRDFYEVAVPLLMRLNVPEVALGVLGWHMACPYAPVLRERGYRFPILNLWGTRGSGKTTTIQLYQTLLGYREPVQMDAMTSPFARMVRMTLTNGVPVHLAEFRSDLPGPSRATLIRDLLLQYDGAWDARGRPDLTLAEFRRRAPVVVDGEEPITEPAFLERSIQLRMSPNVLGKDSVHTEAMERLRELDLTEFSGPYIRWTLAEPPPVAAAEELVLRFPDATRLAERVRRNLTVVVTGLLSLQHFLIRNDLDLLPTSHIETWLRAHVATLGAMRRLHVHDFIVELMALYASGQLPARIERAPGRTVIWMDVGAAYMLWVRHRRAMGFPTIERAALERQLEEEREKGYVFLRVQDHGMFKSSKTFGVWLQRAHLECTDIPEDVT